MPVSSLLSENSFTNKNGKMKKLAFGIISAFLLMSFIPTQLKAATESKPVSVSAIKTIESTTASTQLARLEEIKAMDMSTLSRSEKKELRQEVRVIKNDQDQRSRGYQNGNGRRNHDGGDRNYDGRRGGGSILFVGGGGLLIILLIILLI
jgi:hypothetical protein